MGELSESTAFHEAGHSVLAHLTGVYLVGEIDITDARRAVAWMEGHAELAKGRQLVHGKPIDHRREQAIICAAGWESERKYLAERGLPIDENALLLGALGDRILVSEGIGSEHWYPVSERAALYLQHPPTWEMVTRLAREILRAKGKMSEDHVAAFVHALVVELDQPAFMVLE